MSEDIRTPDGVIYLGTAVFLCVVRCSSFHKQGASGGAKNKPQNQRTHYTLNTLLVVHKSLWDMLSLKVAQKTAYIFTNSVDCLDVFFSELLENAFSGNCNIIWQAKSEVWLFYVKATNLSYKIGINVKQFFFLCDCEWGWKVCQYVKEEYALRTQSHNFSISEIVRLKSGLGNEHAVVKSLV